MSDPKPLNLSSDDDLGELPVAEVKQDDPKPRTCNLDDGPCESCQ